MNKPLDKYMVVLLICLVGINIIAHTATIPPWLTALSVIFLIWRVYHLHKGKPLPSKLITNVLAIGGLLLIFADQKSLMGLDPATCILSYVAALKLLETVVYRDAMLVIFNCFFLLMAHLLNSQSLLSTGFMAVDVLVITVILFQLHKRDRRTSPRSFRPAMRLLALAIPVWVLLFVAFPRFSTGIFRITKPIGAGTGFSDSINPGDVDRLTDSEDPVFRVRFLNSPQPRNEDLYWRGLVLTFSENGLRWIRGIVSTERALPSTNPRELEQEITLEPIGQKWFFALDVPSSLQMQETSNQRLVQARGAFVYESSEPLFTRTMYVAFSQFNQKAAIDPLTRTRNLQIPSNLDPQITALAGRLQEGTSTAQERSEKVLDFFAKNDFRYTKEPGQLQRGLSEFLFETKKGFCEHYAGAYATLMRLMGVPARVVIGFQGGTLNDFSSYLLIRNLDAHAWTEIYVDEESRWLRVDPTATIAPLRIQLGGDFNRIDLSNVTGSLSAEELQQRLYGSGWLRLQTRVTFALDAIATQWNSFLLKYDYEFQLALLEKFGMEAGGRLILFIWIGVGVIIFLVALQWSLKRRALREDPILEAYHDFCSKFEKAGLTRRSTEGPLNFAKKTTQSFPTQAVEINSLTETFVQLRYSPLSPEQRHSLIREFKKKIKAFTIKPAIKA